MVSHGAVQEWNDDEGFGVINSPDTPGGCWAHFSSIITDGYRTLAAGDPVAFTFEAGRQDGYHYRAILVWPPGAGPGTPPSPQTLSGEPGAAYHSTLTIRRDDGTVTTRSGQEPWPS
jgi:cold shock protein